MQRWVLMARKADHALRWCSTRDNHSRNQSLKSYLVRHPETMGGGIEICKILLDNSLVLTFRSLFLGMPTHQYCWRRSYAVWARYNPLIWFCKRKVRWLCWAPLTMSRKIICNELSQPWWWRLARGAVSAWSTLAIWSLSRIFALCQRNTTSWALVFSWYNT